MWVRAGRAAVLLAVLVMGGAGVQAAVAQAISGTVTNKTTNKPAAGDTVTLIRLAQGMQEAGQTTTDGRGHYSLAVPDAGIHLVRVTHQKANYFQPAPPGTTTVNLDVYNVAAKVDGVVGEADVMRVQTDESGKQLKVVENFFIRNDSSPPMTQFSDRPFEFYLPAGAVVEGSAALAPGGMPVQASPVPLGDPNHYAFIFPIRPGETRFQVSYHVPYGGSMELAPRPVMATDTIAVMLPKSMTFKPGASTPYTAVQDEVAGQTYVARNVQPSQPLGFTVSGTGQMPRDTAAATTAGGAEGATAGGAASAAGDTRPGGGLGNPVDPGANNDPWAKYRWWIIGGLGLVLAAGAGFMLKRPEAAAEGATGPGATVVGSGPAGLSSPDRGMGPGGGQGPILAAIKDELFLLETERLQGTVGETEYAEHKAALEQVMRRALRRSGALPAAGAAAAGSGGGTGGAVTAEDLSADLSARSGMR